MSNHPNRSKSGHRSRTPEPSEVRREREITQETQKLGITEAQRYCADVVHAGIRSWQQWESEKGTPDHRRMHPAFWELFLIKTGQKKE